MNECSICFEKSLDNVKLNCLCSVEYCLECINNWFQSINEYKCPICKNKAYVKGFRFIISQLNNYTRRYNILSDRYLPLSNKYWNNGVINNFVGDALIIIYKDIPIDSNIIDCRFYEYNINYNFQYKNYRDSILRLDYIDFNILNQQIYPYFKVIGFYN